MNTSPIERGGILALDVARTIGWAYATPSAARAWPGDHLSARGHDWDGLSFGSSRLGPPGAVTTGELVNLTQAWFRHALRCLPSIVVIERPWAGPARRSVTTMQQLQAQATAIEAVVRREGLMWAAHPVNSIRLHFCGWGRAKKADVLHRCRQIGLQPEDENQSDALALLSFHIVHEHLPMRRTA